MPPAPPLRLHEEILLLALRDREGTMAAGFPEQALAGAILADLLLEGRLRVDPGKRGLVEVADAAPLGDPLLDEGLARIAAAGRRADLPRWVHRLARLPDLRHRAARRLCERGILRESEDRILLLFRRRIYPEIDPVPERRILERLRRAVFGEGRTVDPRTIVLVSLADATRLLHLTFGAKAVRGRRRRIEGIVECEYAGRATREAIAACEAAILVAVLMPTLLATATG